MSESPSATTIAQPFVAAVTETFEGLLGLEAIGTHIEEADPADAVTRDGITALVEFSGPRFGVVLVTFSNDVARAIVERMLQGSGTDLEEGDVTDGVGELVNIVSGRAKAVLSALGMGRLDMSVPTVLTGFSLEDLGLADAEWSRIDFATESGSFTLRVAFAREANEPTGKLRVLIADDSRVMRKIERAALQGLAENVEFVEATDGKNAVDLVEERNYEFDLLVLDLKMPEKDGYEVVAHVRKDPRGLRIPIAIVSSIAAGEAGSRLADASPEGAAPLVFVGKPFDPNELVDAARRVCRHKHHAAGAPGATT